MQNALEILYEDNHLLAINKPAGIATMGAAAGKPSMHALAQDYIKRQYNKPGNVYLGVVSRLDAFVSGVLLFARTSKAAARLSAQFAAGTPQKSYLAIVEGIVEANLADAQQTSKMDCIADMQILEDWVRKNEREHRMEVVSAGSSQAKVAKLAWSVLEQARGRTLLNIKLLTGRKHQIRVQWSSLGHPVLGDVKYGGANHRHPGIGLHSARLTVEHPTTKMPVTVAAPPPDWWRQMGFGVVGD